MATPKPEPARYPFGNPRGPWIAPEVKPYKNRVPDAEYILRPSPGVVNETSQDAGAVQSGMETWKYGKTALHPTVAPGLKLLVEAPFWNGYHFQPQNNYIKYPESRLKDDYFIDMLQFMFENIDYDSFINSLKSHWSDALVYGFAISEMSTIYKYDWNCLKSIKTYQPYGFDLYLDQWWNINSLFWRYRAEPVPDYIFKDSFMVSAYPRVIHGRHYGQSILQSIYFDVKIIEILEQAQAEGVRALAIRPILLWFQGAELSEADLNAVKASLYNMDAGSLVSLPALMNDNGELLPSYKVEVLEDRASHDGVALIKDVLEVLYKRVNRQLLMPDDLGYSNTDMGSYAKAKSEMDMYTQTILTSQEFIANIVNKSVIPFIFRYNYPSMLNRADYRLPKFCLGNVEQEITNDEAKADIALVQMGVLNPQDPNDLEFMRKKYNLPKAVSKATLDMPSNNPLAKGTDPSKAAPGTAVDKSEGGFKALVKGVLGW